MGSDKHSSEGQNGGSGRPEGRKSPEWADGLRQLYDSVVEEPLPDSFKNLLDQLDSSEPPDGPLGSSDRDAAG